MLSPTPPHSPSPGAAPSSAPMRRLAAVWFADLVGYTALSARDEAAALRLVALFQGLSRTLVGEHGGRIVKFVGDAVLAEFGSAEAAVQSALALDASLRDASHEAGLPASLRTGVHLGELTFAPDGDVYGDGVNVAARLQTEAAIGRVLVSEDVWRQLRRRPAFAFTDLGERSLKGHPEPIGTYEVGLRYEVPAAPRSEGASGAHTATTASDGGSRTRLIVLPFRVLRPDPETDFLSFALADAITVSLSGLHSLTMRSTVAGLKFATEAPDLKALAAHADVDRVLAGTLLRAGDQVRVSAQLFDAGHGTVLWTETCQAPLGDLFRLQDDLTNRIVRSLSVPLTAREQRMLKRDVPATARAYEFYLRANQLAQDRSWAAARDLYREALAEDPLYAPAWARLGRCHRLLGKYAVTQETVDAELAEAEAAFRRALELNPDLPLVHTLLSQLEAEAGRAPDAMERLFRRMRGAASADPETLSALVHALRYCGLLEESEAAHRAARRLDPAVRTSVDHTLFMMCDFERVTRGVDSPHDGLREMALITLGRLDEARRIFPATQANDPTGWFFATWKSFLDGDTEGALQMSRRLSPLFQDPEGLYYMARAWAMMRSLEDALGLLERIIAKGYACADTLARDPMLDPLRDRPAFVELRRRAEELRAQARERFQAAEGPALIAAVGAA